MPRPVGRRSREQHSCAIDLVLCYWVLDTLVVQIQPFRRALASLFKAVCLFPFAIAGPRQPLFVSLRCGPSKPRAVAYLRIRLESQPSLRAATRQASLLNYAEKLQVHEA